MKTSVPHYRRCNIVFSAVFTCVLHLFFLSYHGSAVGEERASSNECGVLCLHSIKNQFSAPPMERYGKFKEQFGIIGRNGVSLNELAKCCDGYKLCSKAIHTKDLNVLKEVSTKYGVIAHLLPSHFVIVRNVSAIAVDIAEPPNLLQMKRSEFLEQWSGDLLIISDHEIALQHSFEVWKWIASVSAVVLFIGITYFGVFRNSKWSLHRLSSATRFSVALFFVIPSAVGCDSKLAKQKSEFGDEPHTDEVGHAEPNLPAQVRFSLLESVPVEPEGGIEFGVVHHGSVLSTGEPVRREVVLSNETGSDLQISSVTSSCGCTDIEFGDKIIRVGERRNVPLTVQAGAEGPRGSSVRIEFDQPIPFSKLLTLHWDSVSPVRFVNNRMDLGVVPAGSKMEFAFELHPIESKLIDPDKLSVHCERSYSKAKFSDDWTKILIEFLPTEIDAADTFDRVVITNQASLIICDATYVWKTDTHDNFGSSRLFFRTLKGGGSFQFEIPFSERVSKKLDNARIEYAGPGIVALTSFDNDTMCITFTAPTADTTSTVIESVRVFSQNELLGTFKLVGKITQ